MSLVHRPELNPLSPTSQGLWQCLKWGSVGRQGKEIILRIIYEKYLQDQWMDVEKVLRKNTGWLPGFWLFCEAGLLMMLITDTGNTGRKKKGRDWGCKGKISTVLNRWTEAISSQQLDIQVWNSGQRSELEP